MMEVRGERTFRKLRPPVPVPRIGPFYLIPVLEAKGAVRGGFDWENEPEGRIGLQAVIEGGLEAGIGDPNILAIYGKAVLIGEATGGIDVEFVEEGGEQFIDWTPQIHADLGGAVTIGAKAGPQTEADETTMLETISAKLERKVFECRNILYADYRDRYRTPLTFGSSNAIESIANTEHIGEGDAFIWGAGEGWGALTEQMRDPYELASQIYEGAIEYAAQGYDTIYATLSGEESLADMRVRLETTRLNSNSVLSHYYRALPRFIGEGYTRENARNLAVHQAWLDLATEGRTGGDHTSGYPNLDEAQSRFDEMQSLTANTLRFRREAPMWESARRHLTSGGCENALPLRRPNGGVAYPLAGDNLDADEANRVVDALRNLLLCPTYIYMATLPAEEDGERRIRANTQDLRWRQVVSTRSERASNVTGIRHQMYAEGFRIDEFRIQEIAAVADPDERAAAIEDERLAYLDRLESRYDEEIEEDQSQLLVQANTVVYAYMGPRVRRNEEGKRSASYVQSHLDIIQGEERAFFQDQMCARINEKAQTLSDKGVEEPLSYWMSADLEATATDEINWVYDASIDDIKHGPTMTSEES